jgi:hypothetical protein
MTSPHLDRPLLPLAVVLPILLRNIEATLANEKLDAAEKRLRRRGALIRSLLDPR